MVLIQDGAKVTLCCRDQKGLKISWWREPRQESWAVRPSS